MILSIPIITYYPPAQKFKNFGEIVGVFSQNIVIVAGVIFFILILVAGFRMIRAAGSEDSKAMEQNKNLLTYAVAGFLIIFSAYWVVQIVNFVTGGSIGNIFQ